MTRYPHLLLVQGGIELRAPRCAAGARERPDRSRGVSVPHVLSPATHGRERPREVPPIPWTSATPLTAWQIAKTGNSAPYPSENSIRLVFVEVFLIARAWLEGSRGVLRSLRSIPNAVHPIPPHVLWLRVSQCGFVCAGTSGPSLRFVF